MGSIYVGSNKIKKVYVGSTAIKKVYVGSTLIWSSFNGISGSLSTFAEIKAAMQAGGWIYWTPSTFPKTVKTVKTVTDSKDVTWTLTIAYANANNWYYHYLLKSDSNYSQPGMVGVSITDGSSYLDENGSPLGCAPADDGSVFLYKFFKIGSNISYIIVKYIVSDDGRSTTTVEYEP